MRLDFESFEMDGGSALDRPCDRDYMEIFTASGGQSGLGMGRLCGNNENQHLYIPIVSEQNSPMIRVVTENRIANLTQGYKWRIKITQIDCTSDNEQIRDLRAPEGCLQYFQDRTGVITSFNWDSGIQRQYVKNQDYAFCVKREASDCQITYKRSPSAPAGSTSVGVVRTTGVTTPASRAQNCKNDNGCSEDDCIFSITVPNGNPIITEDRLEVVARYLDTTTTGVAVNTQSYRVSGIFCGVGLGPDNTGTLTGGTTMNDGIDDGIGIISQTRGPFVVNFHTDGNAGIIPMTNVNTNNGLTDQSEMGFSIDYSVQASCQDLTTAITTAG